MRCNLVDVEIIQIDNGFEVKSESQRECYFTKRLSKAKSYANALIDKTERAD